MSLREREGLTDDVVLVEWADTPVEEQHLVTLDAAPEGALTIDAHAAYHALYHFAELSDVEGFSATHRQIARMAGFVGLGTHARLRQALKELEEAKLVVTDTVSAREDHRLTTYTLTYRRASVL
jgi:hypothetical protein